MDKGEMKQFEGKMEKVKRWDRVLSKAEIDNEVFIQDCFDQCVDYLIKCKGYPDKGCVPTPECFGVDRFTHISFTYEGGSIQGWIKDNFDEWRNITVSLLYCPQKSTEYLDGVDYFAEKDDG